VIAGPFASAGPADVPSDLHFRLSSLFDVGDVSRRAEDLLRTDTRRDNGRNPRPNRVAVAVPRPRRGYCTRLVVVLADTVDLLDDMAAGR
jgi:hypothetical protein